PRLPRLGEDGDGPLRGDERLVVARDDEPGPLSYRDADESFRRDRLRLRRRGSIAKGLTREPVLAVAAVVVAAEHPECERIGTGLDMEERLLLDRIALQRPDVAPRHAELARLVRPDLADAAATFL